MFTLTSHRKMDTNPILINYLPTWSRVLPEKLPGPRIIKKILAFNGTRRFITSFTNARHLSLFQARSIKSMTLHLTSEKNLFQSGPSTKTLYAPLLFPIRATCPAHLILLDLIPRIIFGEYRS